MNKELWELIQEYIEAKIEYEIASREEGADGYRQTPYKERKRLETITKKIKDELQKNDQS